MSSPPSPTDSAADLVPPGSVIGIVCALHLEVAAFLDRCRRLKTESGNGFKFRGCRLRETNLCVVEAGTGVARARQATHALIDAFQPSWILSVGFSGGLVESLKVGDLVLATSLTDVTGRRTLDVDLQLESTQPRLHVGRLCTTDHIVRQVEEKRAIAERTGAIAVDMESWGVAEVCHERKTKFMALRAISDDSRNDLPPEVLAVLGPTGSVRAGALLGSLLKRPGSLKDFWRMREHSSNAADHLAFCLDGIIGQLSGTLDS